MKRIKLMLLSLSVLAVVGGALAFTAKTGPFYCTAPTVEGVSCENITDGCPAFNQLKETTGAFICTTTSTLVASRPCNFANGNVIPCTTTSAQLVKE